MKCPNCQREHTLKPVENNAVVCVACGSRFPLKKPSQPVPPQPVPSQPVPSQPAPSQPAPSQPAPSQPAPSQPAPSQPVPPRPVPPRHVPPRPGSAADARTTSDAERPSLYSWSGRATRREFIGAIGYYLLYTTLLLLATGILFVILAMLRASASDVVQLVATIGAFVILLIIATIDVVVTLIPLAASARRLRDAGLSPYLTLLHLLPFFVSIPFTIFLAVYEGKNSETRSQTPKAPRPREPQFAPQTESVETPRTPTGNLDWRRFFSSGAPVKPDDLTIAFAVYAATAVWLFAHVTCDALFIPFIEDGLNDPLYDDVFENDALSFIPFLFQTVALSFIQLFSTFAKLAILTLNLTALAVAILTLVKKARQ